MNLETLTAASWARASEPARRALGARLREGYFEARDRGDAARAVVRAAADVVTPVDPFECAGLLASSHPGGAWRALRVVELGVLPEDARARCALPGRPGFAGVFLDPTELDFRSFEHVLPLDAWFEGVACELDGPVRHAQGVYTLGVRGPRELLESIDASDLYTAPLNATQRGGRRMIFHAEALADALTRGLRAKLPREMTRGLVGVNPVFRASRFEPGDAPFVAHMDTPYRDTARGHVSRYTVLLYVTGGAASPALRVGEVAFDELDAMTCVVFHQREEHEGQAYREGAKFFLRTELVYEQGDEVVEASELGRLFARATYLTGECAFEPGLSVHEHDAYDRVARARWEGRLPEPVAEEPFVHKTYEGVHFVANGYDYWFEGGALEEAAALALLDHFNAKLGGEPFRRLCAREVLMARPEMGWVPRFLAGVSQGASATYEMDNEDLFPSPERPGQKRDALEFPVRVSEYTSLRGLVDEPMRDPAVVAAYVEARREAMARVLPAAIMLMGQSVFIDRSRFVVESNRLHLLSEQRLAPVHFAAASYADVVPRDMIGVDRTLGLLRPLLPPILFRRVGGCWHLRFDFFRNGWMTSGRESSADVPYVRRDNTRDVLSGWSR